jgi:hypothetical protein
MHGLLRSLFGTLLACGPQTPNGSSASASEESGPTTGTSTSNGSTTQVPTSTSTSTSTSTTNDDPSSASVASNGATTEGQVDGEWFGTYTTGFGFARFKPCGAEEGWPIADGLPYFNKCTNAPLWLRVLGTTEKDGNTIYLTVESIISGPCAVGSCEQPDALDECESFETLCTGS